jgi:hypothetical protein
LVVSSTLEILVRSEGGEDTRNFNNLPGWAKGEVHLGPVGAFQDQRQKPTESGATPFQHDMRRRRPARWSGLGGPFVVSVRNFGQASKRSQPLMLTYHQILANNLPSAWWAGKRGDKATATDSLAGAGPPCSHVADRGKPRATRRHTFPGREGATWTFAVGARAPQLDEPSPDRASSPLT